ncbi:GLPGLI family protein [Crocinitomix catalasitica]|nr:GLPGLI family protein [Crocinitomix catalasitica]
MKNVLFLLLMSIGICSISQLSGEISYTTKVNLHKNLPDTERGERMKEWIPEFSEFNNKLVFTSTETLYRNIEEEADESMLDEESGGGRHMRWMQRRMAPPSDIVYCDVENGLIIQKKEFMDKTFLIRDTLHMSKWKLTGDQKEVSGMSCMKAEYIPGENDSDNVVVWFTPEIPVSSGPAGFGGLPGLIVHLNKNDGQVQISLSAIVMRDIEKEEIEEPKKGKVVTEAEFNEIKRKKMEEQRQQWGGRGGFHH